MLASHRLKSSPHTHNHPKQTWILDTYPTRADDPHNIEAPLKGSFQNSDVEKVVSSLEKIQIPIKSRAVLKASLLEQGFTPTLSSWLTTNIKYVSC